MGNNDSIPNQRAIPRASLLNVDEQASQAPREAERTREAQRTSEALRPATISSVSFPQDFTVLVVEDNVSNFVLVARMLGYLGIHCEWKTSGYEVVEYADMLPRLDLILMDIRLPYEDGYGALKKIRASPHLKKTLVVAVTAEVNMEQMNKARQAGFDGFLGKPLDMDRFPDQIRRILNREAVWEMG